MDKRGYITMKKNEENVLFFALSTLNRNPKRFHYCQEENEEKECFHCIGISQLEPGTKLILHNLAKRGEKLNRIVILESQETMQEIEGAETIIDQEFWEDSEGKVCSTSNFYKQRIKDYIRERYDKKILLNDEENIIKADGEETHIQSTDQKKVCYSDSELDDLFYDIIVGKQTERDADNHIVCYQENSLEQLMGIIEKIKGDQGKKINLYVDTQGGSRTSIQQINAVLELLKDQNVTIKGKYAISGFNGKTDKKYVIQEVSDQYRTYDLVSAMLEFKSYGRGNGLAEYFKTEEDENTKRIIALINQISGAISLCNMEEFESALDKMSELKEIVTNGSEEPKSEIQIVFKDIIDNYQELLEKDRNPFKIIKWCVARKYYQQAITIIESKMPKMLTETEYLYYNCEDKITLDAEKISVENICKTILKQRNQGWKGVENYLFETWCSTISGKRKGLLNGNLLHTWEEKCEKYRCSKNFTITETISGKGLSFDYSKYQEKVKNNSKFLFFALLSSEIKSVRNKVNHAVSEMTEEMIKDALDTYIIIGDKLSLSEKWETNHERVGMRNEKKYTATVKSISKKNNVMLDVKDYDKKGDCLLNLKQSNKSLDDMRKWVGKEITVKVVEENGTNWFAIFEKK